jgi:hypothetical protein
MANKFEGNWHYYFLGVDNAGNSNIKDMGFFHLPTVDNSGNLQQATDNDGESLTGDIKNAKTINLNRAANPGPERHLRGDLVFEGTVAGVSWMIIVGERRGHPFPIPFNERDSHGKDSLPAQTDGTWVATKP